MQAQLMYLLLSCRHMLEGSLPEAVCVVPLSDLHSSLVVSK